jgi:hypothetical protein
VVSVKSHTMLSTGYSGTPLAQKLGIAPGARVCALQAPGDYRQLVAPWPAGAGLVERADARCDVVHLFVRGRVVLRREATRLRKIMRDDAALWVSWPKRASRVPSDVSEDVVRELALPLGWVDVKVCAVDATWSGLKLVVRRELRTAKRAGRAATGG